ncbi:ubiquitin-activating enzyme E1 [Plasmodium brasilianum]|uniref:Ubiquitin-activating enzyme E1 n=1 Tax=Plasmodium brasilianum TaxID=5824 RepID=A0ACB9Y3Z0_PLABR|nr:ubiquitin-activating enzyme E1 [Plasmodium brasilianum]
MNELEKFKRQISLWGIHHQEILMSSCICMLGSSFLISEVAKGLILSGISNILIVDDERICAEDFKFYLYCSGEIINEHKCKIIKKNLMNINKEAKINYIIENPLHYFYNVLLKNDSYDIIICNLSVKDNIIVEKLCTENYKRVITCHARGLLGYLNICVNNHVYMSIDDNKKEDFYLYYYLSISLYYELKKHAQSVEYTFFQVNTAWNKLLFLVKCYHDFCTQEKDKSIKNNVIQFVREKLKLTNVHFNNIDKVKYLFIDLIEIVHLIKSLLKNKDKIIKNNHICIFLVVYKSFIKKKKKLPYIYDLIFEENAISTILMNRKIEDKEEIYQLIEKKKEKYNFKKLFNISFFSYFLSHFCSIENVVNTNELGKNITGSEFMFLDFSYLYSFVFKHMQDNDLNMFRKGSVKNFPLLLYGEKEKKGISAFAKCNMSNRRKSGILLCNNKRDILNLYRNTIFKNSDQKKVNNNVDNSFNEYAHEDFPFLHSADDEKSLHRLSSYIDVNINILLEKVQIINNTFLHYSKHMNVHNNCAQLVISGLITQEAIKICSLYLKPHLNYFFFKTRS